MILTVANQKGGTGKTTTAAALAQAAAFHEVPVLAIDLDPQKNLSFALGVRDAKGSGAYEMLSGKKKAQEVIWKAGNLHLIPASADLAAIKQEKGSARLLKKALEPILGNYKLIVIDTPPTAGILQYTGLQTGTDLLIPMQADIFSLDSLQQIIGTVTEIRANNPALRIAGLLLTRYDGRSTLSKQMQEAAQRAAENCGIPYLGFIREGVTIKEAQALQLNMFEYAPRAKVVQEYMALYERITEGVLGEP